MFAAILHHITNAASS